MIKVVYTFVKSVTRKRYCETPVVTTPYNLTPLQLVPTTCALTRLQPDGILIENKKGISKPERNELRRLSIMTDLVNQDLPASPRQGLRLFLGTCLCPLGFLALISKWLASAKHYRIFRIRVNIFAIPVATGRDLKNSVATS